MATTELPVASCNSVSGPLAHNSFCRCTNIIQRSEDSCTFAYDSCRNLKRSPLRLCSTNKNLQLDSFPHRFPKIVSCLPPFSTQPTWNDSFSNSHTSCGNQVARNPGAKIRKKSKRGPPIACTFQMLPYPRRLLPRKNFLELP